MIPPDLCKAVLFSAEQRALLLGRVVNVSRGSCSPCQGPPLNKFDITLKIARQLQNLDFVKLFPLRLHPYNTKILSAHLTFLLPSILPPPKPHVHLAERNFRYRHTPTLLPPPTPLQALVVFLTTHFHNL